MPRDPLVQQATKGDHLPDLTGEGEGEEETRGPSPSKEPKMESLSRSEAQKKVGGRGEECGSAASANPATQITTNDKTNNNEKTKTNEATTATATS